MHRSYVIAQTLIVIIRTNFVNPCCQQFLQNNYRELLILHLYINLFFSVIYIWLYQFLFSTFLFHQTSLIQSLLRQTDRQTDRHRAFICCKNNYSKIFKLPLISDIFASVRHQSSSTKYRCKCFTQVNWQIPCNARLIGHHTCIRVGKKGCFGKKAEIGVAFIKHVPVL